MSFAFNIFIHIPVQYMVYLKAIKKITLVDVSVMATIDQKTIWKFRGGFSPLSPPWIRLWELYIMFLCYAKYQGDKGPQQQLIYLQVWLSARFSNRYWIAYKYFRFCWMQICLISLVTFLIIVLLAWVWLSTRASRLLHKCQENITICVLKASGCWLLFSINQRCHWDQSC